MNIYDFNVKKISGEEISLKNYEGKVLLIVNTASKCGFTPQLTQLEDLYKEYKNEGLEILGFPCNQFASQDPGSNKDISEFCSLNYGVTFSMFEKIDVNGENAHPLYVYLKNNAKGCLLYTSASHLSQKTIEVMTNIHHTNDSTIWFSYNKVGIRHHPVFMDSFFFRIFFS